MATNLKATVFSHEDTDKLELNRDMGADVISISILGKNSQCLTLQVAAADLLHAVKSMIPDLNIQVL